MDRHCRHPHCWPDRRLEHSRETAFLTGVIVTLVEENPRPHARRSSLPIHSKGRPDFVRMPTVMPQQMPWVAYTFQKYFEPQQRHRTSMEKTETVTTIRDPTGNSGMTLVPMISMSFSPAK